MINFNFFNFYKESLGFIKKITGKDCFMFFMFIFIIASVFRKQIKEAIPLPEQDMFSRDIKEQLELQYILDDIVKTHNADYVNVNLFHNGTVSPSGYHFKKMSCIAEGSKEGKLPKIQHLQNWVIQPFKQKIAVVKKVGYVYIPNLKKDKDPYFSQFLPKYNTKSVFYVGLFDERKKRRKRKLSFHRLLIFCVGA